MQKANWYVGGWRETSNLMLALTYCSYFKVTKFSDALNLGILYLMQFTHTKFSDFIKFINWCNQLTMHFTGLVCSKFSEKNKNAKITKFSIATAKFIYLKVANKLSCIWHNSHHWLTAVALTYITWTMSCKTSNGLHTYPCVVITWYNCGCCIATPNVSSYQNIGCPVCCM